MTDPIVIVWFRSDLRLADNRALSAAVGSGASILPVFVLDDEAAGRWRSGAASRWWLHHSLSSLARSLAAAGASLVLRRGATTEMLQRLAEESGAAAIYCTRAYEPWMIAIENEVHRRLGARGVALKRFGGALLAEPELLRTRQGEPYKVYTPFWRALAALGPPAKPLPAPRSIKVPPSRIASETLDSWQLLPKAPDWAAGLRESWQPGEAGAGVQLSRFLRNGLACYGSDRDRPDREGTSRLSPHLHFGEIGPAQCWHAAVDRAARQSGSDRGLEAFLKELAWREFAYTLIVQRPDLPEAPFRPEFASFPWRADKARLAAWQRGRTGHPIVDAGMRQLWHTGWMHNRVRMIVASFLVKDLLIPWQQGKSWFWDTLVDADLANNAASWQWVAGCGADAAPYFRIFNPVTQGRTFDPEGAYVRAWVPELAGLDTSDIHAPWEAPPEKLARAGVALGTHYPWPIVDHGTARARALAAFKGLARPMAASR